MDVARSSNRDKYNQKKKQQRQAANSVTAKGNAARLQGGRKRALLRDESIKARVMVKARNKKIDKAQMKTMWKIAAKEVVGKM